jgi:hemolysin activation/secretion protein
MDPLAVDLPVKPLPLLSLLWPAALLAAACGARAQTGQAPAGGWQLPPVAPPTAVAALPERVRVDAITFQGNTAIGTAELQAIAAPYAQRMCGADELEALRQQLTLAYVQRGYVNSGVLLPDKVADGVLHLQVVEGQLSGIRLHGMDGLADAYITRRLQQPGDGPLNMELLRQRFQLLLTDPLFAQLNARLVPGNQRGEALLEVDVTRARPWTLTAFANNYRPASIGSDALGLAGSARNLTGWGDVLEANLQAPPHRGDGGHGTLGWHVPLGYAGTQLHLNWEGGASSVIEEPAKVLDIRSHLYSRELGISQTFLETLSQKLALGLSRASRSNSTTLLGEPYSFTPGEPTGETRETLWRFWQEYSWRSETQVIALRSSFTGGNNNVQDIAGLPPSDALAKNFHLWTGQANYVRQLSADTGIQLVLRGTLQRSADRLLPLDGLALGGVATVRGFRENQLVRDRGQYLNAELEIPWLSEAKDGVGITLLPFYDWGQARNVNEPGATLSSVGLATRTRWHKWALDLVLAKRLSAPAGVNSQGGTLQDEGVHVQLAYSF